MALGKFSFREIKAHPARIFLTFLSIAIGVAAVVAVLLATATTRAAQSAMLKAVSGRADLEILADSSKGFSYDLLQKVRQSADVQVAVPSLNRFATLFYEGKKARTQVLGMDPRIDQQIRDYELVGGELPKSYEEILLDVSFAESLGLEIGQSLKIGGLGGLEPFKLIGLVRPKGDSAFSLGGAVYMVLPAAQRIFRAGSNIDQILVKAGSDVDVPALAAKLKTEMGEGVTIRQPRTQSDMARETMYATENGLHMAIAFALLIATFIIYNTFQMSVGERRRQLGILRAIGATRRQVANMILSEAVAISFVGALAGCFLGYFGAGFLNTATERMLQVDLPSVQLSTLPFVLAVGLGMSVAVCGALLPAKRASSVQPVEAMRAIELQHNDEVIRRTKPFAFVAIPAGLVILMLAIRGWLPVGADVVAMVLVLLGCVLLIPVLLQRISILIVRSMQPWIGIEAKLAQKQLMRHVGRSTLTIGVLFIAISTSVGMAGNILDNVDNVRAWYARAVIGDFFVRASVPDFATGASADLPPDLFDKLQKMEGVESVEPMRFASTQSGEDTLLVIARNFSGDWRDYFDLVVAADDKTIDHLNAGQVVIGSVLAERRGWKPGDVVPLESAQGTINLTITATTNEYIAGGLTVFLSAEHAAKLLGIEGASALVITAKKNELAAVEKLLRAECQSYGLILQSHAEMVSFIDSMMNGVIASLWMLLALGCIIAAMGLVNTLTMNILEQTREIGMLRVVAMTRQQVRRMIFAQAALLGLIGLIPGALAGTFVSYAISQSALAVLGHNIAFHFRPGLILGCLAFGLLAVMLSSLLPAERAARLKLSSALQYE